MTSAQAGIPCSPLSPVTYLLRNPRWVLLLLGIQALVTCLLVLIISPTNAFRSTSEAYALPLEAFTIVTPRRRSDFDEELLALLDANPGQGQRLRAKSFWLTTPMIVGESYAPLVALDPDDQQSFLQRVDVRLVRGRLPEPGSDGAAIHEAVLRARGMEVGDAFGQWVDREESVPGRFTVVGVLAGDARVGLIDLEYASKPTLVFARREPFQLVYAADGRKAESDTYLREARDADGKEAFRVFDAAFVRARIEKWLRNLPLIVGFITAAVAVVVALVVALLNVIAFQMRVDEFGLYLAIGHRRGRLARKLAAETGLVAAGGWAAGLAVGLLGVWLYRDLVLEPRGIVMHLVDPSTLLFSLSVPLFSSLASALTLRRRLRRMDPVTVIQRRGG